MKNSKFEKGEYVIYRKKGKYYVIEILNKLYDVESDSWSYTFEVKKENNLSIIETVEKRLKKIENLK